MNDKEFLALLEEKSKEYGYHHSKTCIIPADVQQFIKWVENKIHEKK